MAFHCQSNFHVNEPALVSPTSTRDATSSRILACLTSLKHSPTLNVVPSCIDDVYKMEEVTSASRLVAQMALAQIRIAREQQALALSRYPLLLSAIMEQSNQISFETAMKNNGLNALGAAAMIQQKNIHQNSSSGFPCGFGRQFSISSASNADTVSLNSAENMDNSINEDIDESHTKTYVDKVGMDDVLCGRGGRSNHHVGNKRYRLVVAKMKYMYQKCEAKTMKTDLSRAIVKHCTSYGARFLKLDESNGKYYILSKGEARKKTSQALREAKVLKWVN
jgi:hypothetical protein